MGAGHTLYADTFFYNKNKYSGANILVTCINGRTIHFVNECCSSMDQAYSSIFNAINVTS